MSREYHFNWQWDLTSSPEELWPFVSDTNRTNRDTGLPPMQLLGIENGVRHVRYHFPLAFVQWDEEPFEWTYPNSLGIHRRYRQGPITEMRVEIKLEPRAEGGTHLTYQVWTRARNPIGLIGIFVVIGFFSNTRFKSVFQSYDRIAAKGGSLGEITSWHGLSAAGRARFRSLSAPLVQDGIDATLIQRLEEFLDHADDLSLQRIRPYALADRWGVSRRDVLELFLRSTRAGILDMFWDLLCPSCRGTTDSSGHLSAVHSASHCNTCNIDFTANFDHNVEVVFRPNASVRSIDVTLEFCVGSPQRQPHVILLQTLWPREELAFDTELHEGRYLLRASGLSGSRGLVAAKEGESAFEARASYDGWPYGEVHLSLKPHVRLMNITQEPQTFQLERTTWSDQATTAVDVTTLQVFRDLFASEVLRLGEEISVGSVTLMFTDLRDSTRLYRQIGDAPAFGRVREHFEILEKAIALEGGSIIKTMGDSVMAAFLQPASALKAITSAQKTLNARGQGLWLKIGIHHGPCIAVNMNERLDYFGSTVNIAARLPHFSSGGEVIFSQSVRDDPEAMQFLEKNAAPNSVTRFQAEIKGYEETFPLWRMKIQQ
jgi:class 3 adenylate cyclase